MHFPIRGSLLLSFSASRRLIRKYLMAFLLSWYSWASSLATEGYILRCKHRGYPSPLIVSHSLQPSIPHRLISSSTFLSSPDDPRLLPCSTVPDLARPVNLSFSLPSPGQRESELDPGFDRHSDCERICHLLLCVSEPFDNAATSGGLTTTPTHHFRLLAQRLYMLLI